MATSGVYKRGSTWWIRYSRNGRQHFESSKSEKKGDALALLAQRKGQIVEGRWPGLKTERVRYDDLRKALATDYSVNGKRSLSRLNGALSHLDSYFTGMRAVEITTDTVQDYVAKRLSEKSKRSSRPSNATINRELAALKRMLSMAAKAHPPKLQHVPHIPMLAEDNVRQGFFTVEEYRALKAKLPEHLRPLLSAAFWTGMRAGELLSLRWEQLDLQQGSLRLEAQNTKNKKARTIFLPGELLEELKAQQQHTEQNHPDCEWVFHRRGKPISDFRDSWNTACKEAGLEGRLFHDLRRTGVRNLVRAGVPERVAMEISGHKTRSVFDRYNITSEQDLKQAAKSLEVFFASN